MPQTSSSTRPIHSTSTSTAASHADVLSTPATRERLARIRAELGSRTHAEATLATLSALAPDAENKPRLVEWLREGLAHGDRRFELRTALRALTKIIEPRSYLEIGVRRGWSLAQVVSAAPEVRAYGFDAWIENYAGVANPGPSFVRAQLREVAPEFRGTLELFQGNSHDLLPLFFQAVDLDDAELEHLDVVRAGENAPRAFDLVTVDGDHTALGAWWDLCDVAPFVSLGGALVFDDLVAFSDETSGGRAVSRYADGRAAPTDLAHSLRDVWEHFKRGVDNFAFVEDLDAIAPIGIAVRMR